MNGAPAEICFFCDAPLGRSMHEEAPRRVSIPTEGNLAVEPEWRREVSTRLHSYRERRHGGVATDLQSALPFEPPSVAHFETSDTVTQPVTPMRFAVTMGTPKQRPERYEISIPPYESSATLAQMGQATKGRPGANQLGGPIFPVASLSERRRAAVLDAALLLFSYGGMLALFVVLGGHIGFNKFDALVIAATFVMFYTQFFALFTTFGGSTPGMIIRGLRVISFDGAAPTSSQLTWRSFGYLISAGTCFLGFVWALWDEDHLCWQDRISQTYITPVEGFTSAGSTILAANPDKTYH